MDDSASSKNFKSIEVIKEEEPFYPHDCIFGYECKRCIFLGNYEQDRRNYDLFLCIDKKETMIFARFGPKLKFHSSKLDTIPKHPNLYHPNHPLTEAYRRITVEWLWQLTNKLVNVDTDHTEGEKDSPHTSLVHNLFSTCVINLTDIVNRLERSNKEHYIKKAFTRIRNLKPREIINSTYGILDDLDFKCLEPNEERLNKLLAMQKIVNSALTKLIEFF